MKITSVGCIHSSIQVESLCNAYRCGNWQIRRAAIVLRISVSGLNTCVHLHTVRRHFVSLYALQFGFSVFLKRYTSQSAGNPQHKHSKLVSCLQYRLSQLITIPTLITCLGLSETLSHIRDGSEERLVLHFSTCHVCLSIYLWVSKVVAGILLLQRSDGTSSVQVPVYTG